jgi:competence protein ComEA
MLYQFCRLSPVNAVAVPSFNPAPHIKRKDLPMFKQLLVALIAVIAGIGFAFAQIDVNKADQSALGDIKGIGPAMSKHILDARKQGEFKSWDDLQERVAGIGPKSAARLSAAGLTVGGKSKAGVPVAVKPVAAKPAAAKTKAAG